MVASGHSAADAGGRDPSIAVAIVCKTPAAGFSKTRLSPPLAPDECAALSACFIRDLAGTIGSLVDAGNGPADVAPYALYTPVGSEGDLRPLLPDGMRLVAQRGDGFGDRLRFGMEDLLARHAGAILVNSDSPTLPAAILRAAADALVAAAASGDAVVLSPAYDGGYTLIGLTTLHHALFDGIPWSTADVHRLTVERACDIGLRVVEVPGWYDVDDAGSLAMLEGECLDGRAPFGALAGAGAATTRAFLRARMKGPRRR